MKRTIELEPGDINEKSHFISPTTPSESISYHLQCQMELRLGQMLTRPDFSVTCIPSQFRDVIDESTPTAIAERYGQEISNKYLRDYERPITHLLGRLAIDVAGINELVPDDCYIEGIQDQVDQMPDNFFELQEYHESWQGTQIFNLLSAVNELSQLSESDDDWLNKAFWVIETATQNPQQFTPPIDKPESLYLITFLPHITRKLTRRLLVNNHIAAQLEFDLGDSITDTEKQMLDTLRKFYITDTLVGQQWDDLAARYKLSEENSVKMAMLSAQALDYLGSLQKYTENGEGDRFIKTWRDISDRLSQLMGAVADQSKVRSWASQDIGHCFESIFKPYNLGSAFNLSDYGPDYTTPEKTGQKALILEDDDTQRAAWEDVIKEHSSFLPDSDLSFKNPDKIEGYAEDKNIGLFLIDIQNGDDKTAGIHVAETIMKTRLKKGRLLFGRGSKRKTKIIIWSSSSESVSYASDYFRSLEKSLPKKLRARLSLYCDGFGGGGNSDAIVRVEVRNKRWRNYTEIG